MVASHKWRPAINNQFEIVTDPVAANLITTQNSGFPAPPSMNVTPSQRVSNRDTIDIQQVVCANDRSILPVSLPHVPLPCSYGKAHSFNEQSSSDTTQRNSEVPRDMRNQMPRTTYDAAPFPQAGAGSSSHGLQIYQQYAASPFPLPFNAPNRYWELDKLLEYQYDVSFLKNNGGDNIFDIYEGDNFSNSNRYVGTHGPKDHSNSGLQKVGQDNTAILNVAGEEAKMQEDGRDLMLVLKKELTKSDVAPLGRIVLPKREVEAHLPRLTNKDGYLMLTEDLKSGIKWEFKYRFWPNNKSRMYVLEHTAEFVRMYKLQAGDFFMIYRNVNSEKLMVSHKKRSSAADNGRGWAGGSSETLSQIGTTLI